MASVQRGFIAGQCFGLEGLSLERLFQSLDIAVDNIDFTLISYAIYALIGISVIVALLFCYLAYRQRQTVKPVHDYHCISAYMAWEGGDNTIDNTSADSVTGGVTPP